ncbi:MAG: ABC-ATPase domain-containing protein [Nitrospirales bacterium]|nr:ABC-ATPase domain-containing protein [Nitrospira sp.]MDR4501798.1 ABC-ATPase domain-containing protein [Nitrospirales bacterium]
MNSLDDLRHVLSRIDGRGYKAYKDIQGEYDGGWARIYIDHVQGDPFAAPSKIRVRVDHSVSKIPPDLYHTRVRAVALRDFLARMVHRSITQIAQGHRGIGKSGLMTIDAGGQEILERTAVALTQDWVEARLEVGLPASGRTVLGKQAEAMLLKEIPSIIQRSLFWERLPHQACRTHVDYAENYEAIRKELDAHGLVAFVADGSRLPRKSGNSTQPLAEEQVRSFQSPRSLRVTLPVPHPVQQCGQLTHALVGLGIPRGITLIVGGGYHGKSTLLQALQHGVYPHVPGDGREYVVTAPDAVKIRAEDGRTVANVNISGFISHLPQRQSTVAFSTGNASGSTSQAASILEALEMGSTALLMDEDTSATNFLVRDARMQALVSKDYEPITPFLDRVRELYQELGVSTIMVMGGCGDYFDVADVVILLKEFIPENVSNEAKAIMRRQVSNRIVEASGSFPSLISRMPSANSVNSSRGRRDVNIAVRGPGTLDFGAETIDLRGVEQLVDESQTRAVAYAIHRIVQRYLTGTTTLREAIQTLHEELDEKSLDVLDPFWGQGRHPGNFARPRMHDISAVFNRLRMMHCRQVNEPKTAVGQEQA